MADYDFGKKYIETSGKILGLCTPASRPASQAEFLPKYPVSHPISSNSNPENVGPTISNLDEGEIMKGLHVNDALLPSRRHLIQEIAGLVNYSDNLIVSLAALRVLAQISQLHQYEPDSNLAGVAPNRLFSILQEQPGKLESIKSNFRHRLEREETENVQFLADGQNFPHLISTWLLLNAQGDEIEKIMSPDFTEAFGLTNYIRLFIVNFFAVNVAKKSYNLAHYVLGFARDSSKIDQNGCLSLLVDMLMYGLGHESVEAPVIFIEHPALGVRLLSFIRSVMLAPSTISDPSLDYLRNERELFLKLADNINTRLLQVSFSAEKGYALNLEFENVRSSDFHFNVFELQQKTELFQILAMDLHQTFIADEDRLYLEKMINALLKPSGIDSTDERGTYKSFGESRIIDFLAAIDDVTEDSHIKRLRSRYEGEFESALVFEFEAACASYLESVTLLIAELLTVLAGNDEMSLERESFIDSLKPWLWKFMQKTTLSSLAIESIVQLAVLLDEDGKPFELSPESLDAQISVLLRPEISSTSRCFLYTSLMAQSPMAISQTLSEDRFLRLVELVTRDASNTGIGAVNDSLVSVALAILEYLNRARPGLLQDSLLSESNSIDTFSYSIPTAVTSTMHFIPGLLNSLLIDDAAACSLILSHSSSFKEEDYSVLLKWRAKWSLLLNLSVRGKDSENDDIKADSDFAHRFIDGGFLELVLFKFRCLSLNVAYRLVDCGHLVLTVLYPVFKFLCALGMATGRQTAISSRLLNLFRSTDVFDAMSVVVANNPSESNSLLHSHVTHFILFLVNGVTQESASDDFKAKLVSFRHSVLNQFSRLTWSIHRIVRMSSGSLSLDFSARLTTKVQVLQEMIDFLSRDSDTEFISSHLNFVYSETSASDEKTPSTSLSLGTLIFLLKTCTSKLQEGAQCVDLLNYLSKNLDTLSALDLDTLFSSSDDKNSHSVSLENTEVILSRINLIYSNVLNLQNHLVLLMEKASLLLLKHLRHKLSSILAPSDGLTGTHFYIDNRSTQVQAARILKTDAAIIILPLLENYTKKLKLIDSTSNTSLYMATLFRDFEKVLSNQTNSKGLAFELE